MMPNSSYLQLPATLGMTRGEKRGRRVMREQKSSMSNPIRFMGINRIIGICLLLIVPSLAHPQTKQLIDLAVQCRESVGNSFVFEFKEAIRSSSSYTLSPKDAAPRPTLFVDIVCIDVPSDTSTPGAAVSAIAYTFKRNRNRGSDCSFLVGVTLYHGVRFVVSRVAKEAAVGMLAAIDEQNTRQAAIR